MSYKNILKDIQQKKYSPLYLLQGDESYYIDVISDYIEENVLSETEKDFNLTIFYGKDATAQSIIEACRRYPAFAEKQVIILREAKQLKDFDKLENYFDKPSPHTLFIICHKEGTLDKRTKIYKLLQKNAVVYESPTLKENEVPDTITNFLKQKNYSIDAKAVSLLTDYLGTNLSKITNELNKLLINLPEGKKITVDEIEKNIGISKEYNVFELQTALLQKNHTKAFTILHYLTINLKPAMVTFIIGNLHAAYAKLYHFLHSKDGGGGNLYNTFGIHFTQADTYIKAKNIYNLPEVESKFEILLEYDLRSKGLYNDNVSGEALLKELVFKLMY